MSKRLLSLLLLLLLLSPSSTPYSAAQEAQIDSPKDFRSSPVMFIENAGQWDERARFQVWGGTAGTMWLAEDAIWITVVERSSDNRGRSLADTLESFDPEPADPQPSNDQRKAANIKLSFVGANPHPRIEPFDRLDTVVSYFIGNKPDQWRAGVPVWGGVRYVNLYPGVDLEIANENGQMMQRVTARPGADPAAVQLRIEGADIVTADGGVLDLSSTSGELSLPLLRADGLQTAGLKMQPRGGQAFDIVAPFADPVAQPSSQETEDSQSQTNDPTDLLYGTFLGGSGEDRSRGIAVDSAGNAYVSGTTASVDFPTTDGAFDASQSGGYDAFVAKLNADGGGLAYATFLGGSTSDGWAIAVDSAGNAYVVGTTDSASFPTTEGAFDTSANGVYDIFVVKLNSTGNDLAYATLLGGNGYDYGRGIAVDGAGNTYVTGETGSSTFPTTPEAFDKYLGGDRDAFIVKLNSSGSELDYATFLGGSDFDDGWAIAVDNTGSAHVMGSTTSTNFPTTEGAFDRIHNGGTDAFVVELNPTGSGLVYATFLGGSSTDQGRGIAVDGANSVYAAGWTRSADFPVTLGAFDTSQDGLYDAFVVKLNADGTEPDYATFLGGSGTEECDNIAVDGTGHVHVMGITSSSDLPTTPGAFDRSHNGSLDAFVAKLNSAGSGLDYATFVGGSGSDSGGRIAVDRTGCAYMTGITASDDFPITLGAFDTGYNGDPQDTFVVKLALRGEPTYAISGRVLQGPTTALAGVTIASSAGRSTTTDAAGYYVLSDLPAGTCEITPSLTGYVFSPAARSVVVSEVTDEQNFWGRTTKSFLDFPADYGSTALERAFIYGDNGYINSYFDHAYPDYVESTTSAIRRYDGKTTYEAYGGHNGVDFDDNSKGQTTLTSVVAAQDGVVTKVYDKCELDGKNNCSELLGNHVVIDHRNGYQTVYGHLKKGVEVSEGFGVGRGQKLGLIGSTGNSSGPHIHFEVNAYTDHGWQVVDPFGWTPLNDEDPWVSTGGPDSYYLWNWRFENGIVFRTDTGTTTTDPAGFANTIAIAPTTDGGEATATVTNSPSPSLSGIMRSLGRYFRLVLDWLVPTTEIQAQNTDSVAAYAPDITITMPFSTAELLHLDLAQLAIQHYDPVAQQWNSLPTTVDLVSGTAVATTNLTGDFALNAPLLCSGDVLEPDDEREKATPLWLNNTPLARLLDISEDADWAYFSAVEGVQYRLATQNLAGGADTVLRLYDSDGTTLMGTDDNSGGGFASLIQWTAPRTGTYFVEIVGGPSGSTGCSASYELVLTGNPPPPVDYELLTDVLELSWRHDNAAVVQYEAWRSVLPYFDMIVSDGVSKTDVSIGELGALVTSSESLPTDGGHYYRVRGATAGDATPASRELGVFTFSLVQGSL